MNGRILIGPLVAVTLVGCASRPSGTTPAAATAKRSTAAPAPLSTHPVCVLSADCPAGEHCDLQQCVQDCNTMDPCAGGLTCSPRARCLTPGAADSDPAPSSVSAGALAVSPGRTLLGESDSSLPITLSSSGGTSVRYRVEVSGAHLSVANPSGTFTGSTVVIVHVDPTAVTGQNAPGQITIYSSLGNAVVDAPIHVGLTGSYKGRLQYDAGAINLGGSEIALDILESAGAVQVRVDPQDSMLFPATPGATGGAQAATGDGIFTASAGLDATVGQRIPSTFGGSRNPFQRDVGRKIRFQVQPSGAGTLTGTFTESVVGLFAQPITTSGHVTLTYVPGSAAPSFTLGSDVSMPAPPAVGVYPLSILGFSDGNGGVCPSDLTAYEGAYATPPLDTLFAEAGTGATGSVPSYNDVATVCQAALGLSSAPWSLATASHACGVPQELAYALGCGVTAGNAASAEQQAAVSRLVAETLAGPLLVAKNEVVTALEQSFTAGSSAESTHYDTAMSALAPYTTWVLQPAVLEFLRTMNPEAAAASTATADAGSAVQPFPAARALSDLLRTTAAIDAERTRIDAAAAKSSDASSHDTAQQRAVLSYLEMLTLAEILKDWGAVPDSVSASFSGALTPLDRAFAGLLEGANAFGVPDGFVPFVFEPEKAAAMPTNFEQALAIAKSAVAAEQGDETAFLNEQRTYETEVAQLQMEKANLQTVYAAQLHSLCGPGFDPSSITSTSSDWSSCGQSGGDVGQGLLSVQASLTELQDAQSQLQAMGEKIQVDVDTLAAVEQVDATTIQAVRADGSRIGVLDYRDQMWTAAQSALSIAANAQFWNGGAPIAEAALDIGIGLEKANIAQSRDACQTDETIQIQAGQQKTADLQARANIAKEQIDADQALVDLNEREIAVLSAEQQVRDKVAQAQELWQEMQQQVQLIEQDPTKDPSYRLMRDSEALKVLGERASAQQALYLAASALAYEVDTPVPNIGGAALAANNAANMVDMENCLQSVFDQSRYAYGAPQDYVTTISVRQMLGITGSRTDEVTGDTLTEGDQFRRLLLKNQNLDGRGGVGIRFSTDLQPGNGLWADDVCQDRIASVQAQLVGDELGDNQAQVNVSIDGSGLLRSCSDGSLVAWSFGATTNAAQGAFAVVQAGVNTYGDAPPNTALFGQPVARADWLLVIPGGADAPANADVDLTHVDDVVLRIDHKAIAQHGSPVAPDFSCLSTVGN